jgi:hypothetical protein
VFVILSKLVSRASVIRSNKCSEIPPRADNSDDSAKGKHSLDSGHGIRLSVIFRIVI